MRIRVHRLVALGLVLCAVVAQPAGVAADQEPVSSSSGTASPIPATFRRRRRRTSRDDGPTARRTRTGSRSGWASATHSCRRLPAGRTTRGPAPASSARTASWNRSSRICTTHDSVPTGARRTSCSSAATTCGMAWSRRSAIPRSIRRHSSTSGSPRWRPRSPGSPLSARATSSSSACLTWRVCPGVPPQAMPLASFMSARFNAGAQRIVRFLDRRPGRAAFVSVSTFFKSSWRMPWPAAHGSGLPT